MKVTQLLTASAIALLGSTAALASEADLTVQPSSTLSRAEVQADIGAFDQPAVVRQTVQPHSGTVSRAEVKAELARAIADGAFAQATEVAQTVRPDLPNARALGE